MNRPNKELLTERSLTSYTDYINELEKYCDELERINKKIIDENYCFGEVYSECEQYKIALDKACEILSKSNVNDLCLLDMYVNRLDIQDKNVWKEYLLNEVSKKWKDQLEQITNQI